MDTKIHPFIHCPHTQPTHEQLCNSLETICTGNNVDPWLLFILQYGIRNPTVTAHNLSQSNPLFPMGNYKPILLTQTRIGWHHIHYSRFSLEWDRHQRRHLRQQGFEPPTREPKWLRLIIQAIFNHNHARWPFRNKQTHQMNSVDTTERQQLLSCIRALYEHA